MCGPINQFWVSLADTVCIQKKLGLHERECYLKAVARPKRIPIHRAEKIVFRQAGPPVQHLELKGKSGKIDFSFCLSVASRKGSQKKKT